MSLTALATPVPLPLPDRLWGAPDALAALAEARPLLAAALPEPTVVSALTTVVLKAGEHAVKVYPPGTDPVRLERVTSALAGSASAHLPVGPPVVTSYGVLTVAPWLPDARPVPWPRLGALLRSFHDEHAEADVPLWTPLSRLSSQVAGLAPDDAAVLLDARLTLLDALAGTGSELGVGTIHGDVSPHNVMRTPLGPRLIDLDWAARGPREYDLAGAARRFRAGELSRRAYAGFCRSYGYDVQGWPGLPVLDRIAALGGVAFRIWDSTRRGGGLDWLADELPSWRVPV